MKRIFLIALIMNVTIFAQSAFDDSDWDTEKEETGKNAVEWTGFYEFEPRYFTDNDNYDYEILQSLDLGINVNKDKSAFKATVNLDDRDDTELIEELVVSLYLGRLQIDAGRQRLVWGKGDQLHIVDNMNANDYYDFIFPDYLQRRRAEDMIHLNFVVGPYKWNSQIELAYAPSFTSMLFPENGVWRPDFLNTLDNLAPALASQGINIVEEEYSALDDGQYAARWTQSVGSLDFGLSYYNGKQQIPAFRMTDFDAMSIPRTFKLVNNSLEVYGFEFATVLRGINLRGEAAYLKTDDPEGKRYDILNPKWSILLGGDYNLPIHNLNVNVQYMKDFITEEDETCRTAYETQMAALITTLGLDPSLAGIDLNNYYENNLISLRLSDSFFRETLKPEIQYVYRLDNKDSMISILMEHEISEDLHAIGIYRMFSGDSGTIFGQYDANDFLSLRFEYRF
ncbi:MAG: hypothetical protein J7L22_07970 [Candidatus Marinimicrobia bacterium]|nr:hypothetical protein [Candidatus Neomarinimicrobiota bacterium]